jgi:hypothetical protein
MFILYFSIIEGIEDMYACCLVQCLPAEFWLAVPAAAPALAPETHHHQLQQPKHSHPPAPAPGATAAAKQTGRRLQDDGYPSEYLAPLAQRGVIGAQTLSNTACSAGLGILCI